MANVPFYKFDSFLTELAKGKTSALDLTADTLSIYLSNAAPNRALHSVKGDLVEIASKNGYAGMVDLTITSRGIVSNSYRIVADDPPTWAGTAETDQTGFGPFQYVILVDKTSSATDSSRKLLGYWAYPSSIVVTNGNFFKVDFNDTNGMLRLRAAE